MASITRRQYDSRTDFLPIRDFLSELRGLLPPGQSWDVRRWDGSNCHTTEIGLGEDRARRTAVWHTATDRIVAAAIHEGGRQIHPHVHPEHIYLAEEVVAWAEGNAASMGDDSTAVLVWDHDLVLRRVTASRGYVRTEHWEVFRAGRMGDWSIPGVETPAGYRIRPARAEESDHQRRADLPNAAFGRSFHAAEDHRAFVRNAPSYRHDLDLVMVTPDDRIVAYAPICVDEANGVGTFEPVCTHPDHTRQGLARALMLEGLRRSKVAGVVEFEVATGEMEPANALYSSLPFNHEFRGVFWTRDVEHTDR